MPERKRKTVLALIALPVYFSCWIVCAWGSLDSCDQIKAQLSELAKFHPTSLCCHGKDRPDSESTNTKTDCCSIKSVINHIEDKTPHSYTYYHVIDQVSRTYLVSAQLVSYLWFGHHTTLSLLDSFLNFCSPRSPPFSYLS